MGSKRLRGGQGQGCNDMDNECWCDSLEWKKQRTCPKARSPTDSFGSINSLEVDSDRFGSVTKEIEDLIAREKKVLGLVRNLSSTCQLSDEKKTRKEELQKNQSAIDGIIDVDSIIDLDDNDVTPENVAKINPIGGNSAPSSISPVIINLDDEDFCTGGDSCPQWQMGSSKSSDDPPYSLSKPHSPNAKECAGFANSPVIDDINDLDHMDEDMFFDLEVGFRKSGDDIADNLSTDQIVPAEVCTQSARSSVTAVLADTDLTEKDILLPHPEVGARTTAHDASDNICTEKLIRARSPTIVEANNGSSRGEVIFFPDMKVGSKPLPANFLDEVFVDKENTESQLLAVDNCLADQTIDKERNGLCIGLEADKKLEDYSDKIDAYCEDASDVSQVNKDIEVYAGAKDDEEKVEHTTFEDPGADVGLDDDKEKENGEEKVEDSAFKDPGVYVGVDDVEDKEDDVANDDLTNIWNEMSVSLECSKVAIADSFTDIPAADDTEDCDHSFIFKDDIGSVCRVCGLIEKEIESMIEFQFVKKGKKSTKTYKYEGSQARLQGKYPSDGVDMDGYVNSVGGISVHPRHKKLMKSHQVEGFNFLLSNLVTDQPGGCIMAHAPGSGKTFMIICFIQCFMAKYPAARPLIVLPKGILSTWRTEFERWQVENVPLYDFYTCKAADSKGCRDQQLEVLNQWAAEKSILLLGYHQFASIVCGNDTSKTTQSCRDILLKRPSILILDEGHTPRNKGTDILESLEEVQTPRKVVLSGTLYQNHVKEVFNILNLVRPGFLKLNSSKVIKRRILSKVKIEGGRNSKKKFTNDDFFKKVEATLLDDEAFNMKVSVIKDLREMTSKVLHYYKGDSLDELPGLVDFTVYLGLSSKQKRQVQELKFKCRFDRNSAGSSIYVHPQLTTLSGDKEGMDKRIDLLLENLEVNDGVKAKFFLNLLKLCESSGEKLLVFTQYILPLKFLVRLTMRVMGYRLGKEIFVITGDSDSDSRDSCMEQFNTSPDARVFFGSIKVCGEGISLVGASRVIILDVHLNPSVTRQAIGRAFRPGQLRKVYIYRLIATYSPEEEDHLTCFKKESIARMWFEWNGLMGQNDFDMETIDLMKCGDLFLETSRLLNEDVISLCKR